MPIITIKQRGNWNKTEGFLSRLSKAQFLRHLDMYGELGVRALRESTPIDSGETANSWDYEIETNGDSATITWTNSNIKDGLFNVAILLQYGHSNRNGGYVHGIDYINPAMQPVFEQIAKDIWMEVIRLE